MSKKEERLVSHRSSQGKHTDSQTCVTSDHDEVFEVYPLSSFSSPNSELQIIKDCFFDDLKQKQDYCEEDSGAEISKLEAELSAFPKKIPLHEFDQQEAKKELIRYSIKENTLRKEVFLKCCVEIQCKLESDEEHSIDSLRASFYREVQRYDKALPIYAHRLNFMKIIEAHQVCILIGETGSGKSTQLVQYLSEAGYASNGLIACTQPRKLAAISLAEHVSREVDEEVGETYGYVAARSKKSEKTEVLYMTDHTLLNECIADPYLHKYSCLVIDEAHERSIHTDILIAFIKRCLPYREDLKVIITSATIDPTLFSVYFNHCPIIEVPGRTYPVQVNSDQSQLSILERDYVLEAVRKVQDIHISKRNEPGDVLVFLTCPAEIERACKLAKEILKNDATVLPLHGKLQPEDQQKIFECTDGGKRKVVFSTNVAETSVTIPGIVYVIDTGLAKELCYDPQKNMNSLEIRPISKSSADQRKGRAGRTCPGECYRLYSETEYANMRSDSTPEILRITLAFAVMKLYEFGIQDIHSFEFVESPDRKALDEAIENLKFLGAIEDDKLTKLGGKMAFLPLEPNLSKVLLDAIDKGVGMEAAAAVAVSTLAGRVFFRPAANESQEESDKKKLTFCQQSGDQMTYLHTYFEWSQQERINQNKWCVENYVNAKSMRMVQHVIDELRFVLRQKRIFTIPDKIISLDEADKILPKLFFDSFLRNICIHLGHNRIGYWSEKLPTEQLVIHKGSSLHHLNSVPQCVVYETTQKTSQHFLLQALPVRKEWIQEAVDLGRLPCNPADNSLFQFYKVEPLLFANLGPSLSSKLQREIPQYKRKFTDFDIQPIFELSKDLGTLTVFSQKCHHEQVKSSISLDIQSFHEELRNKTQESGIISDNDNVKIVLGRGGCIQKIKLNTVNVDFHTIVVGGIKEDLIPAIELELKAYGKCTFKNNAHVNRKRNPNDMLLLCEFEKPADAVRALSHQFTSFSDPKISIQSYKENRRQFFLEVKWWRRPLQNLVYINFDDPSFFNLKIRQQFNGLPKYTKSDSTGLKFQPHKTNPSIKISGILPDTTEEEVESRLLACVQSIAETKYKIHFKYEKEFPETDELFVMRREHLNGSLARCTPPVPREKYYVDFFLPQPKNVKYRAILYFDDSVSCLQMLHHMRDKEVAYCSVKISLSSKVRYQKQIFTVISPSVEEISFRYSKAPKPVSIKCDEDKWGNTFVNITASDIDAFTEAKEALAKAVEPDIVHFTDSEQSQYASTTNFRKTITEIQTRTSTYIKINISSLSTSIVIYGTQEQRDVARKEVESHIQKKLQNGVACFEVNLKEYGPGLMKHLIREHGNDVSQLPDVIEGITATRLNPRRQILTLFGTEAGYLLFLQSLDSFKPKDVTPQVQAPNVATEISECCVCEENHGSKGQKTFFYRLELCGHVYCKECIQQQLESTTIKFPVTCAADQCDEQLVWRDFENLFKDKVKKLRDITSASLKSYIAKNSDIVHNCITPDCEMVYNISSEAKRFLCGQCSASICSKCHTTWHEGFNTCDAYKNRSIGDKELKEWMSSDGENRKKCPKCQVPIEKNAGCQRVHCACGAHICWKCLKYFETSSACYEHLSSAHGGYY